MGYGIFRFIDISSRNESGDMRKDDGKLDYETITAKWSYSGTALWDNRVNA
jgi:hypothetical protein